MAVTRTACSYCGVGCGIQVETTADPDSGRPVIARVSGDKLHPANFGRLCTKGATHAEMMAADDGRLKSALLRPTRDEELVPTPVDDAVAEAGRRLRAIIDEHGPTPSRFMSPARCRSRRSIWPTNWPRASCRRCTSNRTRGCAWPAQGPDQAVPRRRRAARVLHRLRSHRFVFRHRLEHGGLPSHPVSQDGRPAQGGGEADRRRPASHHHRQTRRPVPADQARHRPGTAQRSVAPARPKR